MTLSPDMILIVTGIVLQGTRTVRQREDVWKVPGMTDSSHPQRHQRDLLLVRCRGLFPVQTWSISLWGWQFQKGAMRYSGLKRLVREGWKQRKLTTEVLLVCLWTAVLHSMGFSQCLWRDRGFWESYIRCMVLKKEQCITVCALNWNSETVLPDRTLSRPMGLSDTGDRPLSVEGILMIVIISNLSKSKCTNASSKS